MTDLTPESAAAELDGCEYRDEGSPDLWKRMKAAGLVAVFGASDDLMELNGAIYDEIGTGEALLTPSGLLTSECSEGEDCPYFQRSRHSASSITALWCEEPNGPCWTYDTDIPHSTFTVMEDGEPFCRGIVFRLADV